MYFLWTDHSIGLNAFPMDRQIYRSQCISYGPVDLPVKMHFIWTGHLTRHNAFPMDALIHAPQRISYGPDGTKINVKIIITKSIPKLLRSNNSTMVEFLSELYIASTQRMSKRFMFDPL